MQNTNELTSRTKLDDYLSRIEAHEKAERRKKGLYLLAFLGVLGVGFTLFYSVDLRPDLRSFAIADLDYEQVETLFSENNAPIIVSHPDIGNDTVKSVEDYINVLNLLDLIERNRSLAVAMYEDEENSEETEEESNQNKLSPYMVDIEGERSVGTELKFSIENYDSEVTYLLDFGNGYRRRVGNSYRYKYNSAGRYRIQLLATRNEEESSVYTKRITITAKESSKEVLASTTIPSTNEPESIIDLNAGLEEAPAGLASEVDPEEDNNPELADNTDNNGEEDSEPLQPLQTKNFQEETAMRAETTSNPSAVQPAPVTKKESTPASGNINRPLVGAQLMPEFPGGTKALARFFRKNYRYPKEAQEKGVEGVVYIRFVVNTDGSLSNAKIVKGIGSGCDEEAIRLVSIMPKWIPGENDGLKVSVYKTIPVVFKLLQ